MLLISVHVFRFILPQKNSAEPVRYRTCPALLLSFLFPAIIPTNSFASLPAKLQMCCRYLFFMVTATILPITAYHLRPR